MTSPIPNGTPVRDRVYRSELASSSNASPSPRSVSSNANQPIPTSQPVSVDALLAAHAGAAHPSLAALDVAVAERNSLSAQNTQLWKLVEKQRSGYSHLMKEIERMRGERDAYRNRLQNVGENTDAVLRAHREKEKREGRDSALRSAASHSHLKSSDSAGSSGSNSTVDPRAQIRSQSDDTAPRHLASSRSLDPTQARSPQRDRQDSQGSLNVPAYNSSASSAYLSASQTAVLHNVPPSNPSSLSTNERTVEPPKSPSITSSLTQDSFATSVPPRTTSLPTSVSSAPAPSSSGAGADTFSAGKPAAQYEMTDNVLGARQPAYNPRNVVRPPPSSQQDMGLVVLTPATPIASPRTTFSTADTNVNGLKSANVTSPPHVPPSPSSRVPPEELQATTDAQPPLAWPLAITVNGDATLSPRPSAVSRDSRISLPEEAKRYYATMTDSPAASPALRSGFGQPGSPLKRESPTAPQTPPPQTQPRTSEESVGLGLATTETAGGTVTGRGWSSGRGPTADKAGSVATEEGAEFLDMDDEDSAYDSGANGSGRISSTLEDTDMTTLEEDPYAGVEDHSMRSEQSKSSRDVVEDFPLPPSTTSSAGYAPVPVASIRAQSQPSTVTQSQVEVGRTSVSSSDLPAQSSQPPFPLSQSQTQPSQLQVQSQSAEPVTPTSPFPLPLPANTPQMKFRALPLLAEDLPHTTVVVSHSSIRPNDRGKEVLSFIVSVEPGRGKEGWKVEKLYSDVLGLDARVRGAMGRNVGKKLMSLPEGRMWRDHAPAKVDQRKNALEQYFKSLIALPIKNKDEVIAFFTCDIVRDAQKPVSQAGYKEGYLTKRGKNFGGWKSRYFVLNGPTLEYYESRGGTHLGSITVTGAQIGRQQRTAGSITTTSARREPDEDNEYRHAFLIIEAKKGPSGSNARHVLCAETDRERDSWVEELVRYVTGSYTEDQIAVISNGPSPISVNSSLQNAPAQPRSSLSSNPPSEPQIGPVRRSTREIAKGPAIPISKLAPDSNNAKLFQNAPSYMEGSTSSSPAKSVLAPSLIDTSIAADAPLSSSLPVSSPLGEDVDVMVTVSQRANSELGHYPDLVDQRASNTRSPEQQRRNKRRMSVKPPSIPERPSSPEKDPGPNTPRVDSHGKVKISAPMNGTLIPAGYKFGGKDAPPEPAPSTNDRREKAKSRTFWNFGRQHDKANAMPVPAFTPRAVFGVSLEESLDVAQIASLPSIVFRCIQYLEAKKAEQEEGIYRLSGSSAVIKSLKDRFNVEGDLDLLASDEYWDPHAIAGLLKTFLRELPASILTRDLHLRFLSVIDFVDPQERIKELSRLIASLPLANYSLLRALTAHLILIVQNANVNKMTMRNVGIVFSPTLGIPAGVFSLMLGEFKRVFNVDGTWEDVSPPPEDAEGQPHPMPRRNSQHYSEAAADQMLGLSGRTLPVSEEDQSDEGDDAVEESGTEATTENDSDIVESSAASSSAHLPQGTSNSDRVQTPELTDGGLSPVPRTRASQLAATRGLNIMTDKASHRHSRMIGLPHSPRPPMPGSSSSHASQNGGPPSPAASVSPSPVKPT